tara:strand:- start:32299 stop:32517 length:219 start_codon:yes stop_codon:yes gene_type:complete
MTHGCAVYIMYKNKARKAPFKPKNKNHPVTLRPRAFSFIPAIKLKAQPKTIQLKRFKRKTQRRIFTTSNPIT